VIQDSNSLRLRLNVQAAPVFRGICGFDVYSETIKEGKTGNVNGKAKFGRNLSQKYGLGINGP